MKSSIRIATLLLMALAFTLGACAGDAPPTDASQSTNTRSGSTTWRCKECHGWDYMGADGAYGSGSHFTGFPGVFGASGQSDGELLAWLDGSTSADHDFSAMGDGAMADLVTFLQEGMIDVSVYIDAETKAAIGHLYEEACAACHGADGTMINFGDDEEPEYLSSIATGNPWEFIHKVRAGQPGSQMPSSIVSGWSMQQVVDVLAYAQTLATEATALSPVSRGGLLYDKWWVVAEVDQPTEDNPVWARQSTNTRSGGDTWRCKECHGWDYMGAFGPYGSGSHFTGFPSKRVRSTCGIMSTMTRSWLLAQILPRARNSTPPVVQLATAKMVVWSTSGMLMIQIMSATLPSIIPGNSSIRCSSDNQEPICHRLAMPAGQHRM
jgi:thiosulfate dehydrogenase